MLGRHLATFDGPARAIRCAEATIQALGPLGLSIRSGIHTGEVGHRREGRGYRGRHRRARRGLAGPSEVVVSQTAKDLTAGSGLTFEDAGEHELKGVPDHWHIY
jgi:class 3 adenylate cyclase